MKLKRIFSALLVIAVICSVASINVFAAVDPIDLTSTAAGGSVKIEQAAGAYVSYIYKDGKKANYFENVTPDDTFIIKQRTTGTYSGPGFRIYSQNLEEAYLENNNIRYVELSMDLEELVNFGENPTYRVQRNNLGNSPVKTNPAGGFADGIVKDNKIFGSQYNVRLIVDRETEAAYFYTNHMLDAVILGSSETEDFVLAFAEQNKAKPAEETAVWEVTNIEMKGWTSDAKASDMGVYNGKKVDGVFYKTLSRARRWNSTKSNWNDDYNKYLVTWFAVYDSAGKLVDVGYRNAAQPNALELESGATIKTFLWEDNGSSIIMSPVHMDATFLDVDALNE